MKRTRTTVAIHVVAAAFFLLGCGQTRKVTSAGPSATGGDASAVGGDASAMGGDASAMAGEAGVVGGSKTVESFGGANTWDPLACHSSPVPEPVDPTAKEQWTLARNFCLALQPDCFKTGVVAAARPGCSDQQLVDECMAEVLWFHDRLVPAECEDAWRTNLECGSQANITGTGCVEVTTSGPYGPTETCAEANAALSDCNAKHSTDVKVVGSYATCWSSWTPASASTCKVTCQLGPYWASLTCSGPSGLPKQCGCDINGHVLIGTQPIFVSDCADATAQAADGLCSSRLDCCFEYRDGDKQACRCEAPSDFGYDSCEAMMAVAQGRQVSICPGLLPDDQDGCWPPGSCSP